MTNQESGREGVPTLAAHEQDNAATAYDANQLKRNGIGGDCSGDRAGSTRSTGATPIAAPAVAQPHPWYALPQRMRERPQWCVVGTDKAPRNARTGGLASSTDSTTWTDFEAAVRAAVARGLGIGYVLSESDPFSCIDLDVKSTTTQVELDRYWKIVQHFDSYTEFSRSGQGLHVWVEGKVGKGRRRDGVELYSQERFIICTGNVLNAKPVQPRLQLLSILKAELSRGDLHEVPLEDVEPDESLAEVVGHAFKGHDYSEPADSELGRLFAGDWKDRYPSQSEADLALVKQLGRHTASNALCWEAFRLSALGRRDKAARPDYMRKTLTIARTHLANDAVHVAHGKAVAEGLFYKLAHEVPPSPQGAPATWVMSSPYVRLLSDDDLLALPRARWTVKGIVPALGVGAIYGPPRSGKSFLTLDLLAHISQGLPWFGCATVARPAVYVPFEGRGGIPDRIRAWRAVHQKRSNIAFVYDGLNLRQPCDRNRLVSTLQSAGWAGGVLCIDTLAQAGPGIEENSSEGMGEMISIFNELQQRLGGVVLVVHHTGKDADRGLRGWSGLLGALDFAVECQFSQEKGATKYDRQFVLTKVKDGEDGRALAFRMHVVPIDTDDDGDTVTSVVVQQKLKPAPGPATDAARTHTEQEQFVWLWIKTERDAGNRPSGRSLEGQRTDKAPHMSQKELRDAIARLEAAGRLSKEGGGRAAWLRAVDEAPIELRPDGICALRVDSR